MTYELGVEKDRFASRLATIPGVQPLPSVGDWILLQVRDPADFVKRVNRRVAGSSVSLPRGIDGAVRVHVGDPKDNETLFRTIRDLVA